MQLFVEEKVLPQAAKTQSSFAAPNGMLDRDNDQKKFLGKHHRNSSPNNLIEKVAEIPSFIFPAADIDVD